MNKKMKSTLLHASIALIISCAPAAWAVNIDLSGATTGTLITAPGGSFAQTFVGQSVSGNSLIGSPTAPLTLLPSGTLEVAFFNGANTILPQPGNTAPLSLLLDQAANSITWTMGFTDTPGGTLKIDFFAGNGSLVHSVNQSLLAGYDTYSFSGFGNFEGLSISDNNDPSGLRYYNFSYTLASVPDGGSSAGLLALSVIALAGAAKRLKAFRA
jgi:hypothetical protein